AGPEAANNASAAGTMVPLLSMGLPTNTTAAVMLAAFSHYNIQAGPLLFDKEPDLVWALIASLFIGNTLLLLVNLPLAPAWARLLQIPRPYLYAGIVFFATLGAYSVNLQAFDLVLLLILGALGFAMRRYGIPVLPLILGVILGPRLEDQLRKSFQLSGGEISGLFNEPVAVGTYVVVALILAWPLLRRLASRSTTDTDTTEPGLVKEER
ncbi:MAG TPA: tripartite tricarboxylate transporter permease, partial [Nocardioidaceae bacterium]|nr:tripartite tricarboxylate transporter permease [Nocardioidaceae bacterium]